MRPHRSSLYSKCTQCHDFQQVSEKGVAHRTEGLTALPNRGQVLPFLDPSNSGGPYPHVTGGEAITQEHQIQELERKKPGTSAMKTQESGHQLTGAQLIRACVIHRESQSVMPQAFPNAQALIQSHYRHRYSPSCSHPPSKMRKKSHRQ